MFNEEECNRLLCPPINHPFHDPCHYHNDKRARLMFLLGQNKENITPDSIKDFEIRDLTISLLYHDCQQEHEFQFFLFKASEFNDLLFKFLTNKGFMSSCPFSTWRLSIPAMSFSHGFCTKPDQKRNIKPRSFSKNSTSRFKKT